MKAQAWTAAIAGLAPRESPNAMKPASTPPATAPASITAIAVRGRFVCSARWKQKKAAVPERIAATRNGERSISGRPPARTRSVIAFVELSRTP
jgi:hypothetical protein